MFEQAAPQGKELGSSALAVAVGSCPGTGESTAAPAGRAAGRRLADARADDTTWTSGRPTRTGCWGRAPATVPGPPVFGGAAVARW